MSRLVPSSGGGGESLILSCNAVFRLVSRHHNPQQAYGTWHSYADEGPIHHRMAFAVEQIETTQQVKTKQHAVRCSVMFRVVAPVLCLSRAVVQCGMVILSRLVSSHRAVRWSAARCCLVLSCFVSRSGVMCAVWWRIVPCCVVLSCLAA